MREPVFNETVQLGIVVRDLEATVRRYVDDYGSGPWEFHQIDAGEANNYREYAQPLERSTRIAVATVGQVVVGQVVWELIEPLEEEGIYARLLAEKGEGTHHVAVATANFDETVGRAESESKVILSGEFSGARVAYTTQRRASLGWSSRCLAASRRRRPHESTFRSRLLRLGEVGDRLEVLGAPCPCSRGGRRFLHRAPPLFTLLRVRSVLGSWDPRLSSGECRMPVSNPHPTRTARIAASSLAAGTSLW